MLQYVMGGFALLSFLLTGVYMEATFPDLYGPNEASRYQYRANHVYILMSGLLNITVGFAREPKMTRLHKLCATVGGFALLLAVPVLIVAFATEPVRGASTRPLTLSGIVLLLFGVILSAIARFDSAKRIQR